MSASPLAKPAMVDPLEILTPLQRGRGWLWLGAVLGAALSALYVFGLATPRFEASALVMIEPREASVTGLEQVLGGLTGTNTTNTPVLRTELEVLRSRSLMARVVEDLNLVADPEFNPSLSPLGLRARLNLWTAPSVPALSPQADANRERVQTISRLQNHLQVEILPNSLVFRITAHSREPEKAARLADALAQAYLAQQRELRRSTAEQAIDFLQGQLQSLRQDLERSRAGLRRFQADHPLSDADTLLQLERRLKETRARLTQAQAEAARATSPPERSRTQAQVQGLERALTGLNADFAVQAEAQTLLSDLQREVEGNTALYLHVQNRLKETLAQIDVQQTDSRLLSAAVIPQSAAAPRRKMSVLVGAGLGVLAVGILLILLDLFGKSLRHGRETSEFSGLPLLAEIGRLPGKDSRSALGWLALHPGSTQAQALRELQTAVADVRVVGLASVLGGEGRSTVTAAFARSLVAAGKKVLILEGDLRGITQLGTRFHAAPSGLSEVLSGRLSLPEAVISRPSEGDLLSCLEAGRAQARDLLSGSGYARLVAQARGLYDLILIDTPPLLDSPDAKLLLMQADTCVMIVRAHHTSRDDLAEGLDLLRRAKVPVRGVVMTFSQPRLARRPKRGSNTG